MRCFMGAGDGVHFGSRTLVVYIVGSAHQYGAIVCISSGSSHLQFLFAPLLFDDDYYYHYYCLFQTI